VRKNIFITVLVFSLLFPFCGKTGGAGKMRLRDFYFFKLEGGKMVKKTENIFSQGEAAHMYMEVEGFGYKKREGGYEIRIAEVLRVYNSDGDLVHKKEILNKRKILKELPPYIVLRTNFGFSVAASVGEYKVIVDVIDGVNKSTLRVEKTIRVKGVI